MAPSARWRWREDLQSLVLFCLCLRYQYRFRVVVRWQLDVCVVFCVVFLFIQLLPAKTRRLVLPKLEVSPWVPETQQNVVLIHPGRN